MVPQTLKRSNGQSLADCRTARVGVLWMHGQVSSSNIAYVQWPLHACSPPLKLQPARAAEELNNRSRMRQHVQASEDDGKGNARQRDASRPSNGMQSPTGIFLGCGRASGARAAYARTHARTQGADKGGRPAAGAGCEVGNRSASEPKCCSVSRECSVVTAVTVPSRGRRGWHQHNCNPVRYVQDPHPKLGS